MGLKSEERSKEKPRKEGLTMMIDGGITNAGANEIAKDFGKFIDFSKIAYASSRVLGWDFIQRKVKIYEEFKIKVFCGGTTLESFLRDGWATKEFIELIRGFGVSWVEVSDGSIDISNKEKIEIIHQLKEEGFKVISEVGTKDQAKDNLLSTEWWIERIQAEIEAGSRLVILEARESGKIGIFNKKGYPDENLIEEIFRKVDIDKIIFEAPKHHQQAYFINRFGANVNLGNIKPVDIVALETLRQGGRADTFIDK